jgi:hypothetical protein
LHGVLLCGLVGIIPWNPLAAQTLSPWTRIGVLATGTTAITLATDAKLYRLEGTGQLSYCASDTTVCTVDPARWTPWMMLPSDTRNIAVAAAVMFYQPADRTLWSVERTGPRLLGRPWAALEIAATEVGDLPVLFALNDDRSFWRNGSGGVDGGWRMTGRLEGGHKIAATTSMVLGLKTDGSVWLNRNEGRAETWERVGALDPAVAGGDVVSLAAAALRGAAEITLYVLQRDRTLWKASISAGIVSDIPAPSATRVDLRARQTRLKDQGGRGTCITFASIAALEAAYKRAGYGDLDLSEEFLNHFGKTFWLAADWRTWPDFLRAAGGIDDFHENQVAAFSGGNGTAYLKSMKGGLRVPSNEAFRYRDTPYLTKSEKVALGIAGQGDYGLTILWESPSSPALAPGDVFYRATLPQRLLNDFNLNPALIADTVLKAPNYYAARSFERILYPSGTVTDAHISRIEETLRGGTEVVFDFDVRGNTPNEDIWTPKPMGTIDPNRGAHSVLLVGYDKTSPDANLHHFIVKNSWGALGATVGVPASMAGVPGVRSGDGYTLMSYAYAKRYGFTAGYVTEVATPAPWPELAFFGRWNLNFDGWRGTLDVYHMPGIQQLVLAELGKTIPDRRIGVFYDSTGKAFRVNGAMEGNRIEFYIDASTPRMRWNRLEGRKFVYFLHPSQNLMTGTHTDRDGSKWGGYATKASYLPAGAPTPRPLVISSFVGSRWRMKYGADHDAMLVIADVRPGSRDVLNATVETSSGPASGARATQVRVVDGNALRISMSGTDWTLEGRHFSHDPGFVAGHSERSTDRTNYPFYMVRQ